MKKLIILLFSIFISINSYGGFFSETICFEKSGQNVPTIDEQNETDEVVDEAREEIRKDTTQKQVEIEKIKLKDPNLSDKQKQNVQRKIDKLRKSLE